MNIEKMKKMVEKIKKEKNYWREEVNKKFVGMKRKEMMKISGGRR